MKKAQSSSDFCKGKFARGVCGGEKYGCDEAVTLEMKWNGDSCHKYGVGGKGIKGTIKNKRIKGTNKNSKTASYACVMQKLPHMHVSCKN